MRWIKIDKTASATPATGTYRSWKEKLAEEGQHQCVYCAVHEKPLGGFWNFHIEHFRPKSKFPELTNEYRNLFYACAICNTFKSNDWPREPSSTLSSACYADPSEVDYNAIFAVDAKGAISGLNVTAKYMIEKLYLQRPQLIYERRDCQLQDEFDRVNKRLDKSVAELMDRTDVTSRDLLRELLVCTREISRLQSAARGIRPYKPSQTKRN